MKDVLGIEVRLTDKLKTSSVCLATGAHGPSLNMEKVYESMNNSFYKAQRILELNPSHEVFNKLVNAHKNDKEQFVSISHTLYDIALLIEGTLPDNPARLAKAVENLLK